MNTRKRWRSENWFIANAKLPPLFPEPIGPAALAILICAGQIKSNPAVSWVPLDLTAVACVIVALAMLASRVLQGAASRFVVVPVALWICFIPAALIAPPAPYALTKVLTLFTISALLAVAPFYLLRRPGQRFAFLMTLVAIALAAALQTLFIERSTVADYSTRLVLEGADTIGTGRIAMAGALIALLLAFGPRMDPYRRIGLAVAAIFLGFLAVASGSRGPVVAVAVAVALVVLIAPVYGRYRLVALLGVALAAGGLLLAASAGAEEGLGRVVAVFTGATDSSTNARVSLWAAAADQLWARPFGSGWGGFASPGHAHLYPHNLILELAVETGIAVTSLFIVVLVWALVRGLRAATTGTGAALVGLFIFALVNAMVSSDVNGGRLLIATTFALLTVGASRPSISLHPWLAPPSFAVNEGTYGRPTRASPSAT